MTTADDTVEAPVARVNAVDRALVRSAIGPAKDAPSAWAARPGDFELDELRDERTRLLPAIGARLAASDSWDPDLPRLRGTARKRWVEHQLQAGQLAPLVEALAGAGVPCWLSGGGAIGRASWGYGNELGLRWTDDTTLLVQPTDRHQAVETLSANGVQFPPPSRLGRRLTHFRSTSASLDDGSRIDLGWSPSPHFAPAFRWWHPVETGETVDLAGASIGLLSPEVALVQICADSEWSTRGPGLSWLLDANQLVSTGSDGQRCDVSAAARLAVLNRLGDVVERRLALLQRARHETGSDWLTPARGPSGRWPRARSDLAGFARHRSPVESVSQGPQFLADRWFLDSAWQLPKAAARRASATVRRR